MVRVRQGEIYLLYSDQVGKPRPVVILSRDDLNGGHSVLAVPFYSGQLEKRRQLSFCVFFAAGTAGLTVDCVAKVDEVTLIDKLAINLAGGPVGRLQPSQLAAIFRALDFVVGR